jgi:integrase
VVPIKRAKTSSKSPVNRTVPNRKVNDAVRTRSHLTEAEVDKLLKVAKQGRHGQRDHLMVLMAFRHGLRVSELCDLQWSDIDFKAGSLYVRRLKRSKDSTHYLDGIETRPLKGLHKDANGPYVFESERGGPISAAGFRKQLSRWGTTAKLGFPVNPHMLRHACGYALANKGMDIRSLQAYLGHASITHTVRYTEMPPTRFKNIWR